MTKSIRQAYNGDFVPESAALISMFDAGYIATEVAIDRIRTFAVKPFAPQQHLRRLRVGATQLGIRIEQSDEEILDIIEHLLEWNQRTESSTTEWHIVIAASNGIDPRFRGFNSSSPPTFLVGCAPFRGELASMFEAYARGVNTWIPNQRSIPASLIPTTIRTRGRLDLKLARAEVMRIDKDLKPILLDPDGFVTEGDGYNVFRVTENRLETPPSAMVVPGVIRETIIALAREASIDVCERQVTAEMLLSSDEIFLTGTLMGLIHVRSINGQMVKNGAMGPLTQTILRRFETFVGVNLQQQALKAVRQLTQMGAVPLE
ncbi:aminotransferase class IV [Streptomyces sp. NPDC001401]|uniref:aminotransferase class IV n=1 Tax=Streptomyces sp. NPDC001401 TaxID=3364570 RepID=UPI003698E570